MSGRGVRPLVPRLSSAALASAEELAPGALLLRGSAQPHTPQILCWCPLWMSHGLHRSADSALCPQASSSQMVGPLGISIPLCPSISSSPYHPSAMLGPGATPCLFPRARLLKSERLVVFSGSHGVHRFPTCLSHCPYAHVWP